MEVVSSNPVTVPCCFFVFVFFSFFFYFIFLLMFVFVALRPKSTAMVMAGQSVHLTTPG